MLRPIQGLFRPENYPDLLVGLDTPDDAAVWRMDESRAIVVTTDFFTPVVDDPYDYGSIAAANSLSDVYAMGGRPFLALNIAALPPDLPTEISSEILRGGAEKALQAGVVIAGGHSIQDKEPKYGLIVVGFVDPQRMLTKRGAMPGDRLVLTKPLGFGVITTALKQERAEPEHVSEVVEWMSALNDRASQLALEFALRSGTDVTGFSLCGHALEMAAASGVGLRLDYDTLPFLPSARRYARAGTFPGGAFDNKEYFAPQVQFTRELDESSQMLMFDPQTSGGLLLAVPPEKLDAFQKRAGEIGQPVWVIGEVTKGRGIQVV